jgi:hypothetical protein
MNPTAISPDLLVVVPTLSPTLAATVLETVAPSSIQTNPETPSPTIAIATLDDTSEKEKAAAKRLEQEHNRRKAFKIGFSILALLVVAAFLVFITIYRRRRTSPPVAPA